ncbi:hypothetical protein Q9Q99_00275 [Curtobacterium flaccumfaciens]|nr:hypothetical protein Q9Q99_00275 [Curtobacterium flaccumfaciens]
MTVIVAVAVLAGVLALATVLGLLLRSRTGRAKPSPTAPDGTASTVDGLASADAFGSRATPRPVLHAVVCSLPGHAPVARRRRRPPRGRSTHRDRPRRAPRPGEPFQRPADPHGPARRRFPDRSHPLPEAHPAHPSSPQPSTPS